MRPLSVIILAKVDVAGLIVGTRVLDSLLFNIGMLVTLRVVANSAGADVTGPMVKLAVVGL